MPGVRLAELSLTGLLMDDLFLVSQIDGMYEDRFSAPKWSSSGNQGGQYGITGLTHM